MKFDFNADNGDEPQPPLSARFDALASLLWQELSHSGMVANAPCLSLLDAATEEYYIDIPDQLQELIDLAQVLFPPKPGHCVAKEEGHHWWRFVRD